MYRVRVFVCVCDQALAQAIEKCGQASQELSVYQAELQQLREEGRRLAQLRDDSTAGEMGQRHHELPSRVCVCAFVCIGFYVLQYSKSLNINAPWAVSIIMCVVFECVFCSNGYTPVRLCMYL